jgi:hypothetical protein
MKQFSRRTARAILVPFALFAIVLGGALPASAASLDSPPDAPSSSVDGSISLSW